VGPAIRYRIIDLNIVERTPTERISCAADHPKFAVHDHASRVSGSDQHGWSARPRIGCNVVDVEVVKDVGNIVAAGHVDFVINYTTSDLVLAVLAVWQRRQRCAPSVTYHIIGIHYIGKSAVNGTANNVDLAIGISMTVTIDIYRHLHPCTPGIGSNVVDAV